MPSCLNPAATVRGADDLNPGPPTKNPEPETLRLGIITYLKARGSQAIEPERA